MIEIKGLDELRRAIARNPEVVRTEAQKLFTRVASHIDRHLAKDPWRVNSGAGGVPVDTGHLLRNARKRQFAPMSLSIYTDTNAVPYARYIHEGTSRMQARPYYESAKTGTEKETEHEAGRFMDAIVKSLAD